MIGNCTDLKQCDIRQGANAMILEVVLSERNEETG